MQQHDARPKNGRAQAENMCGGQRLGRPPDRNQERPLVTPAHLRCWHLTIHERLGVADRQPLFVSNSFHHVFARRLDSSIADALISGATSREPMPLGRATTETPRRDTAVCTAISSMRGICSGCETSS
jgi:hypothetical protein